MRTPKDEAIELVDQKIREFEKVLASATYHNRFDEAYQLAYRGAI